MDNIYNKFLSIAYSSQVELAIVFSMFFQFFLTPKKNLKIFLTIVFSTIFMSIMVVPVAVDALELTGNAERLIYGFTALLSMELLAMLIVILPKGAKKTLKIWLEIEDDKKER